MTHIDLYGIKPRKAFAHTILIKTCFQQKLIDKLIMM